MSGDERVRAKHFVPDTIHAGPAPAVQGFPQYELGYHFFNGLGVPVTIVTRAGVQIRVPHPAGNRLRALVVRNSYGCRQNYGVGYGVIVDTVDLLNDEGLFTSKEAQIIESVLNKDDPRVRMNQPANGVVDYFITREDLDRHNGVIYCPSLDLVISILNPHYTPKHPYSRVGQRQALIDRTVPPEGPQGLNYVIRIIDRLQQHGDRFINIAGEVYLIKAEVDESLADGVYLVSAMPATGEADILLPRALSFPFDKADQALQLYRTYTDAKTLGDPKSARERELAERAHQMKIIEAELRENKVRQDGELEESKRSWERERIVQQQAIADREDRLRVQEQMNKERQQEIDRQAQANAIEEQRLKKEILLLKDQIDRRSTMRKETLEVLKHLPALISGVGALYMFFKTIKK